MSSLLLGIAVIAWLLALLLAAANTWLRAGRYLLACGCTALIITAVTTLPGGMEVMALPVSLGAGRVGFSLSAPALWLLLFGALAAAPACWLGTPNPSGQRGWLAGAAFSLLGALGVFGLQDGIAFLVAWEVMSLGGAVMILGEKLAHPGGRCVLFMLSLLEVGSVALVCAFLLLGRDGFSFAQFAAQAMALPAWQQACAGVLLLIGFGAKLGLLPFYEWFPAAYGAGSGASGNLLSGMILNAAFFGLSRGLTVWLSQGEVAYGLSILVIGVGVASAILAVLYAFQENGWRELLSFSTAENAAIAVTALGAALLFHADSHADLAGLALLVALLQLAGHSLAKGALFLAADGVYLCTGGYRIAQHGLLKRGPWLFGIGAVFAGMSLAAMPPQAGFVSEWYLFQTVFQGFHLSDITGRLVMALAGAGLALTAAIAFGTFVKVLGIGLQGQGDRQGAVIPRRVGYASGILGLGVLALAVGMPWWLHALSGAIFWQFSAHAATAMRDGLLLVPLTSGFAFISPTLLVIVCPLLALLPLGLLLAARRFKVRRTAVWYGGLGRDSERVATTALTFSNAMRTFYGFVYRPTLDVEHEHLGAGFFLKRLKFNHKVAPVFGPLLFLPLTQFVNGLAKRLRALQSGHLNFYLALTGILLVLILAIAVI